MRLVLLKYWSIPLSTFCFRQKYSDISTQQKVKTAEIISLQEHLSLPLLFFIVKEPLLLVSITDDYIKGQSVFPQAM